MTTIACARAVIFFFHTWRLALMSSPSPTNSAKIHQVECCKLQSKILPQPQLWSLTQLKPDQSLAWFLLLQSPESCSFWILQCEVWLGVDRQARLKFEGFQVTCHELLDFQVAMRTPCKTKPPSSTNSANSGLWSNKGRQYDIVIGVAFTAPESTFQSPEPALCSWAVQHRGTELQQQFDKVPLNFCALELVQSHVESPSCKTKPLSSTNSANSGLWPPFAENTRAWATLRT
jgi:hypothetical protein